MEEDDPLVALRDARSRFIAAFPAQLGSYLRQLTCCSRVTRSRTPS
jgi:hypothetical protein